MSFWFFSRQRLEINLGIELAVELHNHVLPGVDDGARSMQEALQMMLFWAEMGYQKVIATPHQNTLMNPSVQEIDSAYSRLQYQLQEQEIPLYLTVAGEYLLEPELRERIGALRTFGPKNYLLVELGFWILPIGWQHFFFELQCAGYTLVLAHPERYEYANESQLKTWYEQGLFLQINLLSLAKAYGKKAQQKAEYLLEKGWVHFIGSDMHRADQIEAVRYALKHKLIRKRMERFLNPTLL
ncbi:MAG: CpsB/CapC family capsule biosynthesis tyrosine phosphatase [Bacteroidia bacterium]|nr:histidinol-phosphatase [Bacteroidia bacterium]MDW8134716.1 CpsB/CapC family capsule biosynthesis tyrosine phosphatase [Bacteroidia bacterium]